MGTERRPRQHWDGFYGMICLVVFISFKIEHSCGMEQVIVNCTQNTTIVAPPPLKTQHIVVNLDTVNEELGCFFIIKPFNATTKNHLITCIFDDSFSIDWKYSYYILNINPQNIFHEVLSRLVKCDTMVPKEYKGREGWAMEFQFESYLSNNVSLGYLQSLVHDEPKECNTSTTVIDVTSNKTVLTSPHLAMDVLSYLTCSYRFVTQLNRVSYFQLSVSDNPCETSETVDLLFSTHADKYLICKHPINVVHKTATRQDLYMTFKYLYYGGAQPQYTFTFWSEPLCLASNKTQDFQVRDVRQSLELDLYPLSSEGQGQCHWCFNTSNDQVIKINFHNDGSNCAAYHDLLTLDGKLTLDICNNFSDYFTYWSTSSFLTVDYAQGIQDNQTRRFHLTYISERPGYCQGRPIPLEAKLGIQTMTSPKLSEDVDSRGTECQWIIKATHSDYRIKITFQSGLKDCSLSKISFYEDGNRWNMENLARCLEPNKYVSSSNKVLVVYTRDWYDSENLEMSFQETLDPAYNFDFRRNSGSAVLQSISYDTFLLLVISQLARIISKMS